MGKLIALSLGDEPDLNNPAVRDTYVKWFNADPERPAYAEHDPVHQQLRRAGDRRGARRLHHPRQAGHDQLRHLPVPLRGPERPDARQPTGGSPMNWYARPPPLPPARQGAEHPARRLTARRTTALTRASATVSESEIRLQTFVCAGVQREVPDRLHVQHRRQRRSSTTPPAATTSPTRSTPRPRRSTRRRGNLGQALVRLKPVADAAGGQHTTEHHVHPRQALDRSRQKRVQRRPRIHGFAIDPASQAYTDWEFGRNDPYLSGPFNDTGTTNLGTLNGGLRRRRDHLLVQAARRIVRRRRVQRPDLHHGHQRPGRHGRDGGADAAADQAELRQQQRAVPYDHLEKLDRATGQVVERSA